MLEVASELMMCVYAGTQQTPQQIWGGLESILPALQILLSVCNTMSPSAASSEGVHSLATLTA